MNDPLYGLEPDSADDYGMNLGMATRGERGTLVVTFDSLPRMSSNPFFSYMMERIEEGIDPCPTDRRGAARRSATWTGMGIPSRRTPGAATSLRRGGAQHLERARHVRLVVVAVDREPEPAVAAADDHAIGPQQHLQLAGAIGRDGDVAGAGNRVGRGQHGQAERLGPPRAVWPGVLLTCGVARETEPRRVC